MSLNNVSLVGRLTRDPDLRYTPNGVAVANFNIAVDRPFKGQEGKQETDFINCVAWRKLAENLAEYQKKGSLIAVTGSITTRNYDGQDGKRVYVTEVLANSIEYLESKNSSGSGSNGNSQNNYNGNQQKQSQYDDDPFKDSGEPIDIDDSDLPF